MTYASLIQPWPSADTETPFPPFRSQASFKLPSTALHLPAALCSRRSLYYSCSSRFVDGSVVAYYMPVNNRLSIRILQKVENCPGR